MAFTLTAGDVERMWIATQGRCAVSGIRFNERRFGQALVKYPFRPSLDQIKARQGYTPANIRLVCVAANFGMNEWGLDVLTEIAEGVVERRGTRPVDEQAAIRKSDREWIDTQRRLIEEAEQIARGLSGPELQKQRRRIAALKRNLTLEQQGLARAGEKAAQTKRKAEQEWIDLRRRLIDEAEDVARGLSGAEREMQRRRIAALKRNLKLGKTGLARAGRRAAIARKTAAGSDGPKYG